MYLLHGMYYQSLKTEILYSWLQILSPSWEFYCMLNPRKSQVTEAELLRLPERNGRLPWTLTSPLTRRQRSVTMLPSDCTSEEKKATVFSTTLFLLNSSWNPAGRWAVSRTAWNACEHEDCWLLPTTGLQVLSVFQDSIKHFPNT